jgi:4-hydroxy-tetrahydrodipicolinate synthase
VSETEPWTASPDRGSRPEVQLGGVSVVPIAPMRADLSLDEEAFADHVAAVASAGISMFIVGGHTGEFHSLSDAESHRLVDIAVQVVGGHRVIAAVGRDLGAARAMATAAQDLGCSALMVHQPPHPAMPPSGYLHYVGAIADVCELGLVPYLTDAQLAVAALPGLVEMDRVIGVKWGVSDLQLFTTWSNSTRAACRPIAWVCGLAERWAPFYSAVHPVGFTSGLANVNPRLSIRFATAVVKGDRTAIREMWPSVARFESMRSSDGGNHSISIIKLALSILRRCEPVVRPPLAMPTAVDAATVQALLEEWNLTADVRRESRITSSASAVSPFAPSPSS